VLAEGRLTLASYESSPYEFVSSAERATPIHKRGLAEAEINGGLRRQHKSIIKIS
jgi:hypothetical protein